MPANTPLHQHPTTTHTVPPPAPVTHARVVHACGYRKTRADQPRRTDVVPQHVLCRGRPSRPYTESEHTTPPRLHPATIGIHLYAPEQSHITSSSICSTGHSLCRKQSPTCFRCRALGIPAPGRHPCNPPTTGDTSHDRSHAVA